MTSWIACLLVLAFYAAFYRTVVRHWGRAVHAVLRRTTLLARQPLRDIDNMSKLAAAGIAQIAFAVVLVVAEHSHFTLLEADSLVLLVAGAALGLGELALASFLCRVLVETAMLVTPADRRSATARRWVLEARGGWMGQFGATLRVAPGWFALSTVALYVAGEELVFRAVLIGVLRPEGALVAVGGSTVLFAAVQVFHMPSVRAAMFPVVGALVIGTTHAAVFWRVPQLLPLVVAHLTFMLGATSWPTRPRVAGHVS